MQLTNKQILTIAAVAGIAIHFCRWVELLAPEFCIQYIPDVPGGIRVILMELYGLPLLLSIGIGYIGYKTPVACWLLFMLPSSALKIGSMYLSESNLAPPFLVLEVILFALT